MSIGRAYARVIGELEGKPVSELRLGLAHDMRLSAPELAASYCEGMLSEGATVLDGGRIATEMLYFLVGSRDLDGGLMCTASHNPKAYTGAKLIKRGAIALSGDAGIGDIRKLIEDGLGDAPGGGTVERVDVTEEFQESTLKLIDAGEIKPLRVVVDGGNGMAGPMVGPLLERLGLDLREAYWVPDGNFPDHEPNPLLPENREFIMSEVVGARRRSGHRVGRGRRPVLLHRRAGGVRRRRLPDRAAGGVDARARTPARRSSTTSAPAGRWPTWSQRSGGRALMNRVGHAFFKTRMREEGGVFGGEVSGHYYFRDFYCADSGTLPALLILELLSRRGKSLSELLEPYRSKYFISGEINSEVDDQESKLTELADRYTDGHQYHLDGLSVEYDDWHFNVRPSNTEPLLRLCLESLRSHEDMERRRDEVLAVIRS